MRLFNSCTDYANSIFSVLEEKSDVIYTLDSLYVVEELLCKYAFPLVMGVAKKSKTITGMVFCLENKKNLTDTQKYNTMEISFKAPRSFGVMLNWYDSTLVGHTDMRNIILLSQACDYNVILESIEYAKKQCVHSLAYLKAVCITRQREANEEQRKAEEINKKLEEAKTIFIKDIENISDDEADKIRREEEAWLF